MNENMRIKSTNYPVIIIILAVCAGLSFGLHSFVQMKFMMSGASWLAVALIWGLANLVISYMESVHRQEGKAMAFFKSLLEFILLMFAAFWVMYFFNYNMIMGLAILTLYTGIKMCYCTSPYFNLREMIEDEPGALRETGIWIPDSILDMEAERLIEIARDKYPVPPVEEVTPAPVRKEPLRAIPGKLKLPPANAGKLSLDMLKKEDKAHQEKPEDTLEKMELREKRKGREVKEKKTREDGIIMAQALSMIDLKKGESAPMDFDNIIKRAREQYRLLDNESFTVPEKLSRKGCDRLPELVREDSYKKMENRREIQLMSLSVSKEMADLFNMKLKNQLELTVTFPWELEERDDKNRKLAEKMKVGDKWIVSVTGSLPEDITFAILTANLADIWIEESAHPEAKDFHLGFSFWLCYKLLKKMGYMAAAQKAVTQNKQAFNKIRDMENEYGEYGVFHYMTSNKYPQISVEEPLKKEVITIEKSTVEPVETIEQAEETAETVEPHIEEERPPEKLPLMLEIITSKEEESPAQPTIQEAEIQKTEEPAEPEGRKLPDIFRKAKLKPAQKLKGAKKLEVDRLEIDVAGTRFFRGMPEASQFVRKAGKMISLSTGEIETLGHKNAPIEEMEAPKTQSDKEEQAKEKPGTVSGDKQEAKKKPGRVIELKLERKKDEKEPAMEKSPAITEELENREERKDTASAEEESGKKILKKTKKKKKRVVRKKDNNE